LEVEGVQVEQLWNMGQEHDVSRAYGVTYWAVKELSVATSHEKSKKLT
jgi:hypothetical protein